MKKFSHIKFIKPDLKIIEEDFNQLINNFTKATTFEEQDLAFKEFNQYCDHIQTNFAIAMIRYTADTTSKENEENQNIVDEIQPLITSYCSKFNQEFVKAKFANELKEKYGQHIFNMTKNQLESFDEKIIPELQEINRLSSEYTKVIASAQIPFEGKIYNLSQIGKFTQSHDRETRKKASLASAQFFADNNEKLGDIYSKLVAVRTKMAQKLGYKNFVELGYKMLGRTDYNAEMVKAYREQIYNDLVPFTNQLFAEQIKRLNISNPQYYDYNVMFNSGNPTPKGDKNYLVAQATKMYEELSPATDKFFKFMQKYELLDLEARAGKNSGGYEIYLPDYKAPFIFSNFNGTSGDVDVLTHEFGHAFQGYMSRNIELPDYRSPTLEACEMHSMSMEYLTYPWMDLFFDNGDKYRYAHVVDGLTFIPYGVLIDEFQHWVYENPNVTHQERCAKFREIEKKYLPHRKYDEAPILENGGWWLRQGHVFESPFYYIDYTLAQMVAFEFFNESNIDYDKTWKKYLKLCKLGGRYPFTQLLKEANLYNPFIDGTIKKIVEPLKVYLAQFDTTKF